VGDETVVYDLETKEAHCLKGLASIVFSEADGKRSAEDIAVIAEQKLGEPVGYTAVQDAIMQLEGCELLDTPLKIRDGLSRRDLVRKAGYAGAAASVASPLITSILAPYTAMATTIIPAGCSGCGGNPQCATAPGDPGAQGHCCQNNAGKSCNQGCCVGSNNSCHFCDCVGTNCDCTVAAFDIGGQCPCICGTPGCINTTCCPPGRLCCVTAVPENCT
jgi:hypothetical protein